MNISMVIEEELKRVVDELGKPDDPVLFGFIKFFAPLHTYIDVNIRSGDMPYFGNPRRVHFILVGGDYSRTNQLFHRNKPYITYAQLVFFVSLMYMYSLAPRNLSVYDVVNRAASYTVDRLYDKYINELDRDGVYPSNMLVQQWAKNAFVEHAQAYWDVVDMIEMMYMLQTVYNNTRDPEAGWRYFTAIITHYASTGGDMETDVFKVVYPDCRVVDMTPDEIKNGYWGIAQALLFSDFKQAGGELPEV